METNSIKNRMAKDTLLYIPAKAIEGVIGIATLSLYTSYFKPDVYGNYNLAVTTVNITCLLLLGWLIQSVFRYINSYSEEKSLNMFFSTVFSVWGITNLLVLLMGLSMYFIFGRHLDKPTALLIFASIFMFLTYSSTQILFALLGASRIIKLNLILSVVSVTLKLAATVFFVKMFHAGIFGAILSILLVDTLVIIIIVMRLKVYSFIKVGLFSRKVLSDFTAYGIPLVGVSITMSMLNVSDRYIVKLFLGSSELGIYTANYSVASAVFSMILLAVMRGVYPMILKTWKQNDKAQTEELLSHAVRYFLLVGLPAVIGLSVLSPKVSMILAPEYISGYSVMIWVSAGMFFLGLTEYNNKAWELTSKTGKVFRNSLLSCLLNIGSNFVFVPIYGFKAAAVNTTLSYLLYFILSYVGGRKILKWTLPLSSLARIAGSAILMGVVLYAVTLYVASNLLWLAFFVLFGMLVYFAALYLTGEIKAEVHQALGFAKKIRTKSQS